MPWKTAEHKRLAIKEVERAGLAGEVGMGSITRSPDCPRIGWGHCTLYWVGVSLGVDLWDTTSTVDSMEAISKATGLRNGALVNIAEINDRHGWKRAVKALNNLKVEGE